MKKPYYLTGERERRYRLRYPCLETVPQIPAKGFGQYSFTRSCVTASRSMSKPAAFVSAGERFRQRPSKLVFAESLSQSIRTLAEAGDPVAAELRNALAFARFHARDLFGNHFAMRAGESLVSFCPKGKAQGITDSGTWERAGRQTIKPGKWVQRILRRSFPDHEIAAFASRLVATFAGFTFNLSQDFETAYASDNYAGEFTSCMADEPVGEFYRRVGAQVLTVAKDGKLHGRAIVWEDAAIAGQVVTLMDRTYTVSTAAHEAMIAEAERRGWWHKIAQTSSNSLFTDGTNTGTPRYDCGEDVKDLSDVAFFPYLDTLAWQNGRYLTTVSGEHDAEYRETDGTRESHEGQVQDVDGDWIDEDDAAYVDGDYYHRDDDRITWCEQSEEYFLTSETYTVETPRGTFTIHERYVTSN